MMSRLAAGASLLSCGVALALSARPASGWQTFVDDVPNANGEARALAIDPAGDVLAVGAVVGMEVVKLAGASGATLWRQAISGTGVGTAQGRDLAVAPDGDAVVAASLPNLVTGSDFAVLRLDSSNGSQVWRTSLNGTEGSGEEALAVEVDAAGDVIAAGRLANVVTFWDLAVVKLAGGSGTELWRYERSGTANQSEEARALAIDPNGDVVVAGFVRNVGRGADLAVVKIDGSSGTEIWRREVNGPSGNGDEALDVAVDAAGDVVACGFVTTPSGSRDFHVLKLSGADGSTLWSHTRDGGTGGEDVARAVSLGPGGRVFVAGRLVGAIGGGDVALIALDGADGSPLWTYQLDGTANAFDEALAVATSQSGDPVVVGFLDGVQSARDMLIARVGASDGSEVWRQIVNGSASEGDEALAVYSNGSGNVIVGGAVWRLAQQGPIQQSDPSREFTVMKVEAGNGADLRMVTGQRFVLLDRSSDPQRRLLTVVSQDPTGLVPPVRGSPGDPRPAPLGSGAGGRVAIRNPTTGEFNVYPLPAEHWDTLGTDKNPRGFRYRDPGLTAGPCRAVILRLGRRLRVNCKGGGIGYSLNESQQGSIAAMVEVGETPISYCTEFGGLILDDFPVRGFFGRGRFRARDAPAPAVCAASEIP